MGEQQETRTFHLLKEPWIPVANVGEVSLMDVFTHPEYRRLGGNAVEKVVILRLLLCIAHACCEVRDEDDWKELTAEQLAANARAYLEKWQDRFDLYDDERPFLQFPQLKGKCAEAPLGAIALQAACGNRTVLTQWQQIESFTPAEAARLLLAGVAYGCGGKKYDMTTKIDPSGASKGKSAPQCPLTGYFGYLHSFMLGGTLLETIRLNMLTEEDLSELNLFSATDPWGRPFWESMPVDENGKTAKAYRESYQGILFPLSKFLCLDGDSLLMTEGISYPTHKTGQWDPGITLFTEKNDTKAIWCSTEKKPWRQLPALMKFMATDGKKTDMPAFLVLGIPKVDTDSFGIWTGGVAIKNQSGEQYVSGTNDYVDSEFTIPWEWTQKISFNQYAALMEMTDQYAKRLYGKVRGYFSMLNLDKSDDMASSAVRQYWERMEPLAQEIINLSAALAKESDTERYEAMKLDETRKWQQIANVCYEQFCPHVTPRQIQAFVHPFKEKASDENAKDSAASKKTRGTKGSKK